MAEWLGPPSYHPFARVLKIGVSQSHLSIVEQVCSEAGAEVLFAISREFGKSLEWLLTGEQ